MARPRTSPQPEVPGLAARRIAADILDGVLRRRVALDEQLSGKGAHPGLAALADRDRALMRRLVATVLRRLGDVRGLDVADLCAAPGGKTAQLAYAGARVTAVDRSAGRLMRLSENLTRLSLQAETVAADVLEWQGGPFDAALLDAPCSSTGTIRRHPDVPWRKSETCLLYKS